MAASAVQASASPMQAPLAGGDAASPAVTSVGAPSLPSAPALPLTGGATMVVTQTSPSSSKSWSGTLVCFFVVLIIIIIVVAIVLWCAWGRSGTKSSCENVRAHNLKANGNLAVGGCACIHGVLCTTCGLVTNDISGGGALINISDPVRVQELRLAKTTLTDGPTVTIGAGSYIELANQDAGVDATLPLAAAAGEGRVIYITNATAGASCNLLPSGADTLDYGVLPIAFTLWAQAVSDGVSNWTVSGV